MRKGFDDTRVLEARLERNPFYRTLSSVEFSLFLMSLIGIAALMAAFFPQGMDEPFYVARFGERLYRIYDSLGLLSVFRSWWFMLLFLLLLAALVFCSHARVREGRPRGTRGTRLYETDFSVPTATEDVLLIFPVLLSSIGFRKRRIITGEGHWEILAERGVHPSVSSLLLHISAAFLLVGLLLTYVFSWGGSTNLETGSLFSVPFRTGESRWTMFTGRQSRDGTVSNDGESIQIKLLRLTRYYGPFSGVLPSVRESPVSPPGSMTADQLFIDKDGKSLILKAWESRLYVRRNDKADTLDLSAGESKVALGLHISQGPISRTARIAFSTLGETLQVSVPSDLRLESVRVGPIPSLGPLVGRTLRFESAGDLGQRKVRVRVLPVVEHRDTANVSRGYSADLGVGEEVQVDGLTMKVVRLSDWSLVRVRSDPGGRLVKLGAFLIFLFTMVRLYMYCYILRAEISGAKGGPSHLSLRIRSSGLLASPAGVARKIAGLLAK